MGTDSLSGRDRLVLETAKSLREDFLQQNAFHEDDSYASLEKQALMMRAILTLHRTSATALEEGAPLESVMKHPLREEIARSKYIGAKEMEKLRSIVDRAEERAPSASDAATPVAARSGASGGAKPANAGRERS